MKSFLLLMFFCGIVFSAKSTTQMPDIIIYNGIKYSLYNNPLENYFAKFPEKRPKGEIISSALWRGYRATFELIDSTLFLIDIEIEVSDSTTSSPFNQKWKSVLKDVFPSSDSLILDWYDGILMLPDGEMKNYAHYGNSSIYEQYKILEIKNGSLKTVLNFSSKDFDNFKKNQIELFKKTKDYEVWYNKMIEKDASEELIERVLNQNIFKITKRILN